MKVDAIHKSIKEQLQQSATAAGLKAFQRFVPGEGHQAYGVRMPVVNALAKTYKTGGFDLVKMLWQSGMHEEKLMAAKMLGHICKSDNDKALQLFMDLSESIENWAQCDALGMSGLKPVSRKLSSEIFKMAHALAASSDFWQRRLSLVMVETYTREASLHPAIHALVARLEGDKAYFVKKAVIWIKSSLNKQLQKMRTDKF